ncbi:hypothetical protein [Cytobacillus praedii]|uniref:Uncharacterized protein n=1 Tax=Cytobacillus praedii TaxID=1742358 RepID=A0A4R1ANA2_9BACI|nr:hypothetical protein [Cytobacillus praedii]TCJ01114.1 hypothetical protein E0Y62_25585 [Cytobacillus praedii]
MLNKYQYKDRDYINDIIEKGFTSKFINTELKLLAKYYQERGNDETIMKDKLQSFCEKNLKGYNPAVHYKVINNAVSYGLNDKNKIIQINNISISQPELDYIDNLDLEHNYKRVVFTLLVLQRLFKNYLKIKDGEVKSDDYYFGGFKNYRDLVSVAKITFDKKKKSKVKNVHDLIRLFHEKGIVQISNNGNIKLLFMYEIPMDDSEEVIVNDYNLIGYYYDLYHRENRVKECEECGVPIKTNSNKQIYCGDCSKEKDLKKYRKYNTKRKNHQ